MTRRRSPLSRFLIVAMPIAALAATLAAAPAAAADREFYVGFHLGLSGIEIDRNDAFNQVLDGDENSLSYDIGYKWNDYLAVEVGYYDLSKVDGAIRPCAEGVSCSDIAIQGKITAYSVAIVPHYDITGRIRVFAKLGLVSWDANVEDAVEDLEVTLVDVNDEDLIYGAGVEVQILGRLRAVGRLESIAGDIETVSAGIRLVF